MPKIVYIKRLFTCDINVFFIKKSKTINEIFIKG